MSKILITVSLAGWPAVAAVGLVCATAVAVCALVGDEKESASASC